MFVSHYVSFEGEIRAVAERIFFNEHPYKSRVCPFLLLTVRIAVGNMSLKGKPGSFHI